METKHMKDMEQLEQKFKEQFIQKSGFKVFTDGSGDYSKKIRTAGIGIYFGKNDKRNVSEPFKIGDITHNRAEMYAVIRAMMEIANSDPTGRYDIYSDSSYVINSITKWLPGWMKKGWKKADGKPVENRDLWEKYNELNNKLGGNITYKWMAAHKKEPSNKTGVDYELWEGNMHADELAVAGRMRS